MYKWFHHVTTVEFTVAVNVWSEFDAAVFAGEANKRWLPFWEDEQTAEEKTQILRNYLTLLLSEFPDVLPPAADKEVCPSSHPRDRLCV